MFGIINHRYSGVLHFPFDLFTERHHRSQTVPSLDPPTLLAPLVADFPVPSPLPFRELHWIQVNLLHDPRSQRSTWRPRGYYCWRSLLSGLLFNACGLRIRSERLLLPHQGTGIPGLLPGSFLGPICRSQSCQPGCRIVCFVGSSDRRDHLKSCWIHQYCHQGKEMVLAHQFYLMK